MPQATTQAAARKGLLAAALAATGVLALVVYWHARQRGLIYPDAYEYLLMARGLGEHLSTSSRLGPGGMAFHPSVDAALKPLFPALLALGGTVASYLRAGQALTALSAACAVPLAALVARKGGAGLLGGALAGALVLASPDLRYWSGFLGPDPLAVALGLACAWAALCGRLRLAGALGALCTATRPEWGLVLLAICAGLALARPGLRAELRGAFSAWALTLALVLVLVRPPIAFPKGGPLLVAGALLGGSLLFAALDRLGDSRRTGLAAGTAACLALLPLLLRSDALRHLAATEWPLFAAAACGLLWACWRGEGKASLALAGAVLLLEATYAYRDPHSGRYVALLIPLLALLAGLGLGPGLLRASRGALLVACVALLAFAGAPAMSGQDIFSSLAPRLKGAPQGTLVTAAPTAYGYLLPGRAIVAMRPGARGLILIDGSTSALAPGLVARGRVMAEYPQGTGFLTSRPTGPALLVEGVVSREQARHK
jgi:hypothetical protein